MSINPRLLSICLTEHPDEFNKLLALLEYDESHIFGYDPPEKGLEPWVFLARATLGLGIVEIEEPRLNLRYYALIKIPDIEDLPHGESERLNKGWPVDWLKGDITEPHDIETKNKVVLKTSHDPYELLELAGTHGLKAPPPSKTRGHFQKHEFTGTEPYGTKVEPGKKTPESVRPSKEWEDLERRGWEL